MLRETNYVWDWVIRNDRKHNKYYNVYYNNFVKLILMAVILMS